MNPRLLLVLMALVCLAFPAQAAADWGECETCHQTGGTSAAGFPYGLCAHCHEATQPRHDPEELSGQCAECHPARALHLIHPWEAACAECHGPTRLQGPRIFELDASQAHTKQMVTVRGTNFGPEQGESVLRVGKKRYRAGCPKLLSWSNTEIRFMVKGYREWREGWSDDKNVCVKVNGVASNKVPLTISKPF
jgi:hypothetical protein